MISVYFITAWVDNLISLQGMALNRVIVKMDGKK